MREVASAKPHSPTSGAASSASSMRPTACRAPRGLDGQRDKSSQCWMSKNPYRERRLDPTSSMRVAAQLLSQVAQQLGEPRPRSPSRSRGPTRRRPPQAVADKRALGAPAPRAPLPVRDDWPPARGRAAAGSPASPACTMPRTIPATTPRAAPEGLGNPSPSCSRARASASVSRNAPRASASLDATARSRRHSRRDERRDALEHDREVASAAERRAPSGVSTTVTASGNKPRSVTTNSLGWRSRRRRSPRQWHRQYGRHGSGTESWARQFAAEARLGIAVNGQFRTADSAVHAESRLEPRISSDTRV